MRWLVAGIVVAGLSLTALHAEERGWSEPVSGLRARLEVLPPAPNDRWFCRLYLEFQNVANGMGCRKIAFSPRCLALRLTDAEGKPLPSGDINYDGLEPIWEPLILPFDGTLRFQFGGHGLGVPAEAWRIVDNGPMQAWVIRRNEPARLLSGTLTLPRTPGSHPFLDWNGTLILPPVPVPAD